MYCRNCGKEIDDRAVICVHCGVPTDNLAVNNSPSSVQPKLPANGLAIAGLVISLIGLFGGNYLFLVPSIVGLIFSIVGMTRSKTHSLPGLAIASLIVSIVAFIIWLIIWIAAFSIVLDGYGLYVEEMSLILN